MYDNVNLWLPYHLPDGNASALAGRYNGTEIADRATGEIKGYQWHVSNMLFKCFSNGISVKGSWPKFLYGDNVQTISTTDAGKAIADISSVMGVDMSNAIVSNLEFGKTFEMTNPPVDYFAKLGDGGRLPRQQVETTLYYGKLIKKPPTILAFYDKANEIASRGDVLPPLFDGVNLLRYEIRLHGRLSKRYGIGNASALTDKAIYRALQRVYVSSYENIKKVSVMADGIKPNKDWILASLIQMHPDEAQSLLASAKARITAQEFYRLKSAIEQTQRKAAAKADELLLELSDDIKSVCC